MNRRNRQLVKALDIVDNTNELILVVVPARIDLLTGDWLPPQHVEVYRDQLDIYRQIYGNRLFIDDTHKIRGGKKGQ